MLIIFYYVNYITSKIYLKKVGESKRLYKGVLAFCDYFKYRYLRLSAG
jgi:hypothetical protein